MLTNFLSFTLDFCIISKLKLEIGHNKINHKSEGFNKINSFFFEAISVSRTVSNFLFQNSCDKNNEDYYI